MRHVQLRDALIALPLPPTAVTVARPQQFIEAFSAKDHTPVMSAYAGIQEGGIVITDRRGQGCPSVWAWQVMGMMERPC